jgi:hypothetical protein
MHHTTNGRMCDIQSDCCRPLLELITPLPIDCSFILFPMIHSSPCEPLFLLFLKKNAYFQLPGLIFQIKGMSCFACCGGKDTQGIPDNRNPYPGNHPASKHCTFLASYPVQRCIFYTIYFAHDFIAFTELLLTFRERCIPHC